MIKRVVAGILGIIVGGLATARFVSKEDYYALGALDVERKLTAIRVPIVLSLLYTSVAGDEKAVRNALASVGISYVGIGTGALVDRKLGGTLEEGLTDADIIFHLVTGTVAVLASLLPDGEVRER